MHSVANVDCISVKDNCGFSNNKMQFIVNLFFIILKLAFQIILNYFDKRPTCD